MLNLRRKQQMGNIEYRFAELRAIPPDVDETRTVEFVISNESRDRHGTVLRADKWKLDNYKRNPVVGYNHTLHGGFFTNASPDDVIGKGEVFFEGKNLIGRVTFEPPEMNPLAEKVFQKVKFGTLRTASVGFIPMGEGEYGKGKEARGGEMETLYLPGQELIEWSIVHIPSNPRAAKRAIMEDTESFLELVQKQLEGKYTIEDLQKMTMKGIIGILSGESVEKDKEEGEVSQAVDNEKTLAEIEKRKKQHEWMKTDLERAKQFGDAEKVIAEEEIAKRKLDRQKEIMGKTLEAYDDFDERAAEDEEVAKKVREQNYLKGILSLHSNFENVIKLDEKARKDEIDKAHLRMRREQNRYKDEEKEVKKLKK